MKHVRNLFLFFSFFLLGAQILLAERPGEPFSFYHSNPNISNSYLVYYEIKPGDSIIDEVIIKNQSSAGEGIYGLYGVDKQAPLASDPTGAKVPSAKDAPRLHVGKWVSFNPDTITVPLNSEMRASYTVKIPSDTPEGSYEGYLIAERLLTPDETDSGATLVIATRTGLQLNVKVTSTPQPNVTTLAVEGEEETESTSAEEDLSRFLSPLNIVLGVFFLLLIAYVLKLALRQSKK